MANLHLKSGLMTRPWTASEYKKLLESETTRFFCVENGFLIGRIIGEEAEILNVIVHPNFRRLGKAKYLICKFEKQAKNAGSAKCFLEVAESNNPANKLYSNLGYVMVGRRESTTILLMEVKTMHQSCPKKSRSALNYYKIKLI